MLLELIGRVLGEVGLGVGVDQRLEGRIFRLARHFGDHLAQALEAILSAVHGAESGKLGHGHARLEWRVVGVTFPVAVGKRHGFLEAWIVRLAEEHDQRVKRLSSHSGVLEFLGGFDRGLEGLFGAVVVFEGLLDVSAQQVCLVEHVGVWKLAHDAGDLFEGGLGLLLREVGGGAVIKRVGHEDVFGGIREVLEELVEQAGGLAPVL